MKYLHTMVRIRDLDASLDFYCNKLGLVEVRRVDVESAQEMRDALMKVVHTLSGGDSVTDEGLEGLVELEHLRRLNVISSLVTSRGVAAIAASPSASRLEYLKIAQARVGDEIVPLLLKCQQLKVLDLYGTQLTDRGLSQLHRLPRLTCLRIAETPVTHTGIQDLLRLRPGLYVDNAP